MRAFVVGAVDYGEADRIVRLLSSESGRTAVIARKARASQRRFRGAFNLGNLVDVQLGRGRGGLTPVNAAEIVRAPSHARTDLERIALLSYGCELCAGLAPEHHPARRLFKLLDTWLALLEADAAPGHASRVALESKALTFAGLAPVLTSCARCGSAPEAPMFFDAQTGGAVHGHCGGGVAVTSAQLAQIEQLRWTPLVETPGVGIPANLQWLLSDFVRYHMGQPLKSRTLIEQLESPR